MREAHKGGGVKEQTVKVGDIVLVHDDVPRAQWQLAVIEELIKDLDGLTRSAKIPTETGRTNRPIVKLYPLEVNSASETAATPASSNNETASTDNGDVHVSRDVNTSCPRVSRYAATKAHERIKNWTNTLSVAPEDVED